MSPETTKGGRKPPLPPVKNLAGLNIMEVSLADDKGTPLTSAELKALTDPLFEEVKAAEQKMDRLRWEMSNTAQWRAQSLRRLRVLLPVAMIANRLGVERQAIYAALSEDPPDHEIEDPGLPSLRERLQEYSDQFRRWANADRAVSVGPVGAKFLVRDLDEAIGNLAKVYKGQEPLQ